MKVIYLAHQLGGDFEANIASAEAWARWAITTKDVIPLTPYLSLIRYLDDKDPAEQKLGHKAALELVSRCDEFWMGGPVPAKSSFVWKEKEEAEKLGLPIIDFTGLPNIQIIRDA